MEIPRKGVKKLINWPTLIELIGDKGTKLFQQRKNNITNDPKLTGHPERTK